MKRRFDNYLERLGEKINEYLPDEKFDKHLPSRLSFAEWPLYWGWLAIGLSFILVGKILASKLGKACLIVVLFCVVSVWTDDDLVRTAKGFVSNLFENAESIAVASASVVYFLEIPNRKKRDQYEAWQVINSGLNQTGSGGRIQALEDLKNDGVDLEGVAAPKADLSGINLSKGKLKRANLSETQLDEANLQEANLSGANLYRANLQGANLRGANMNIRYDGGFGFMLYPPHKVNLNRAILHTANLSRAGLKAADLRNADLTKADLTKADLTKADLTKADLTEARLDESQLSCSILCQTKLPAGFSLDPNRDCPEQHHF